MPSGIDIAFELEKMKCFLEVALKYVLSDKPVAMNMAEPEGSGREIDEIEVILL